jgi:hypothetical protein
VVLHHGLVLELGARLLVHVCINHYMAVGQCSVGDEIISLTVQENRFLWVTVLPHPVRDVSEYFIILYDFNFKCFKTLLYCMAAVSGKF